MKADIPPYKLRKTRRAKRLSLAVFSATEIVVTAPRWLSRSRIDDFLAEKKAWLLDKLDFFANQGGLRARNFTQADFRKHKAQALALVQERVRHFSLCYGFVYNKITIRNQKSRWGSCSIRKNLNFNVKILFLTPEEQDYIIVHELCHLQEFNHSDRFWRKVEAIIPDYQPIKRGLRKRAGE